MPPAIAATKNLWNPEIVLHGSNVCQRWPIDPRNIRISPRPRPLEMRKFYPGCDCSRGWMALRRRQYHCAMECVKQEKPVQFTPLRRPSSGEVVNRNADRVQHTHPCSLKVLPLALLTNLVHYVFKKESMPGTESNCRQRIFSSLAGAGLCDTIGRYVYLFERLTAVFRT